jgi:hypothetical protein
LTTDPRDKAFTRRVFMVVDLGELYSRNRRGSPVAS